MTYSKFILSFLLASVFAGCSTESQKKTETIPGSGSDFKSKKGTNFRVKNYVAKSASIETWNSYGIPSSKAYNFQACIQERLGKSPIRPDTAFLIEDGKNVRIQVETDNEGCLNWHEVFSYNHLMPEALVHLRRTVKALSTYKGEVEIETAFNPWSAGAGATIELRNSRHRIFEGDPDSLVQGRIRIMGQSPQPIEISVDTLNLEFKGLNYDQYEISKLLNLTVAHKYTLRIKPQVIRQTLERTAVTESLTGGRLRAYLAIFVDDPKLPLSQNTLITAHEFDLNYVKTTGQFMADVTLKFKDISEMTSRTRALLTLVPLDELEGLKEMNYEGLFKPAPLTTLSLSPGKESARNFFNSRKAMAEIKPLDFLKSKDTNLNLMNLDPIPNYYFSFYMGNLQFATVLQKALYSEITSREQKYLIQALCMKLYPVTDKEISGFDCQSNPGFYMKSAVRHIVEEITSKPEPVGDTSTEEFEMKISLSASQKSSYNRGWKFNMGGGLSGNLSYDILSIPKESPLNGSLTAKLSAGYEYNWVWEGKYSEEDSVGVTSTSSIKVSSEGNTFKFNAKVRPCVFVLPGDKYAEYLEKKNIQKKGVYYCGQQVFEQKDHQETWYLLTQELGKKDSPFSDSISKRSGPWRMMIRGRQTQSIFREFMKASKIPMLLEQLPSTEAKTQFDTLYLQTQEFPGLLPAIRKTQ